MCFFSLGKILLKIKFKFHRYYRMQEGAWSYKSSQKLNLFIRELICFSTNFFLALNFFFFWKRWNSIISRERQGRKYQPEAYKNGNDQISQQSNLKTFYGHQFILHMSKW